MAHGSRMCVDKVRTASLQDPSALRYTAGPRDGVFWPGWPSLPRNLPTPPPVSESTALETRKGKVGRCVQSIKPRLGFFPLSFRCHYIFIICS